MSTAEIIFLALYFSVLAVLSVYGSHRYRMAFLYYRHKFKLPVPKGTLPAMPRVTVQLPVFNEMYVVERLIDAVCRIEYPRDLFEVQVLDDSTDETCGIARACVERWKEKGVDVVYVHRVNRQGFKAGALEHGLLTAKGEFVAVFDADFVPGPDFLTRTVPFFSDPQVGMVQVRWGHLNREFSLLTQAQSILLDGHFIIEHTARNRSGCFFNFNGTAGIWRRGHHRRRRRLAARHADRRPRPELPRAAQGLAVRLPARRRLAGRSAGGHERLQEPAAPLGQGLHPDGARSCCRRSCAPTCRTRSSARPSCTCPTTWPTR